MNLASVDMNLLVALDLLLDERSVRGAARRAGVSASAMSHTLRRLRDTLGDEVLVRAGRGMVATARGEALVHPVKDVIARARALLDHPDAFDPLALRRRFYIACTDHVSTVLLSEVERALTTDAPHMDWVVLPITSTVMSDLRKGAIDVAIGVFPDAAPEMRQRRLFTDRFVTVHRADHPRLGEKDLTLDAFLAEDHILVAPRGTPSGHVDRLLAERHQKERRVARAFPGFLAALWHAMHSDALLTVSSRLVHAAASAFPLRVQTPPLALADYTLNLIWHPRTHDAASDAWFRDTLAHAASRLGPL